MKSKPQSSRPRFLALLAAWTFWAPLTALSDEPAATVELRGLSGREVCALLAHPGDFHLNAAFYIGNPNSVTGNVLYHTIDPYGLGGYIVDVIKGRKDPVQKWSHAALVGDIDLFDQGNIVTRNWFLGVEFSRFDRTDQDYNTDFAIYRVEQPDLEINEKALINADKMGIPQLFGVCADAIDGLYDHTLSKSTQDTMRDVHEALGRALGRGLSGDQARSASLYKGGVSTPNSLAQSSKARQVCEVRDEKLVSPKNVSVDDLLAEVDKGLSSRNYLIRRHSLEVLKFLVMKKIATPEGTAIARRISFAD